MIYGNQAPAFTRDLEIHLEPFPIGKLEGYDRDWKDAGNDRKKSYSNLSPRNYRFRVMASNNSGVWNNVADNAV